MSGLCSAKVYLRYHAGFVKGSRIIYTLRWALPDYEKEGKEKKRKTDPHNWYVPDPIVDDSSTLVRVPAIFSQFRHLWALVRIHRHFRNSLHIYQLEITFSRLESRSIWDCVFDRHIPHHRKLVFCDPETEVDQTTHYRKDYASAHEYDQACPENTTSANIFAGAIISIVLVSYM